MSSSSSQKHSILDEWEAEAYSSDCLSSPERRIPQVRTINNGASLKRFDFSADDVSRYFDNCDPYTKPPTSCPPATAYNGGKSNINSSGISDIITRLCQRTELAIELGKHLRPQDIVALYSISRAFNAAVSSYMLASVRIWIAHKAPVAGGIFPFKLYRRHLVADPAGRTWAYQYNVDGDGSVPRENGICADKAAQVRTIPGLKYLQLVTGRDRYCREILAILARNGHRTPASMHRTLLKQWLLLEIPTSAQRSALLRNSETWTEIDLYNAQMLFVKLGMHFNDPVYGPNTYELLHLMMGQKGLFPLWQLLLRKRFTHLSEILALKVRYDMQMPAGHWGHEFFDTSIHGVPYADVGRGHLECWGRGGTSAAGRHLMRPDELVPIEAVARGLELDKHIVHMMVWGYVDLKTGENLVPSEEEMYISDAEEVLAHADTSHHWRRKHVLKKRFSQLSPSEQQEIIDEDEDDRIRAMAWCGEVDDYSSASSDEDDEDAYSLNDEIRRGYIVRPRQKNTSEAVQVPHEQDRQGWVSFVNKALMGLPPALDEDEALRAQAWQSYQTVETEGEWDWPAWMAQEERRREVGEGGEYSGTVSLSGTEEQVEGDGSDAWEEEGEDDID